MVGILAEVKHLVIVALILVTIMSSFILIAIPENYEELRLTELFTSSILINMMVAALLLYQLMANRIDNKIRNRPWIGRSKSGSKLENQSVWIPISNHGHLPATEIQIYKLNDKLCFEQPDPNRQDLVIGEDLNLGLNIFRIEKDSLDITMPKNSKYSKKFKNIKEAINTCINNEKSRLDKVSWFALLVTYSDARKNLSGLYFILGQCNDRNEILNKVTLVQ